MVNGLATTTTRNAKNVDTAAKTGTTHTIRSRAQLRFRLTAAAPKPVSTSSQRSSEPSCPPQKAEIVYAVGSASLVERATYVNEKSLRSSATRSTTAATAVVAKDATSAFCAERASRRRPRCASGSPGDESVEGEAEGDEERGATSLRHE